MKALVLHELKSPLSLDDREGLVPAPGEAIIAIRSAALNRRDYWITQGMYPGIKTPIVLGSDGAGVVARVADDVDANWVGKDVIINPGLNWGDSPVAQANRFEILGMPQDGTFAEELRVPAQYLHEKPSHLDWTHAAALPLAGVTAFRAVITQGQVRPGEQVLVTGVGGGVATFAVQFAVQAGAKVFVTSSSAEKIRQAVELGATAGFDYRQEGWAKEAVRKLGPMDLTIDSAGGAGYADLLSLAAPGGRIVNYGATAGPPKQLDLFKLFWKQLHLIGSTMGSPADFQEMLDLVNKEHLQPIVDVVVPLAEGNAAFERMKSSEQFGKMVLEVHGGA